MRLVSVSTLVFVVIQRRWRTDDPQCYLGLIRRCFVSGVFCILTVHLDEAVQFAGALSAH